MAEIAQCNAVRPVRALAQAFARELRDNPTGSVRKVCGFLGIEPLPGSVLAETVFTGDYPRPARNSLRMRLLRWLLRRELRDMRERYGVEFD